MPMTPEQEQQKLKEWNERMERECVAIDSIFAQVTAEMAKSAKRRDVPVAVFFAATVNAHLSRTMGLLDMQADEEAAGRSAMMPLPKAVALVERSVENFLAQLRSKFHAQPQPQPAVSVDANGSEVPR